MCADMSGVLFAVFAPSFPPAFRGGGTIRSVEALVETCPGHFRASVLTSVRDVGQREALPVEADSWVERGNICVRYVSTSNFLRVIGAGRSLQLMHPNVLYMNSFFNIRFSILPLIVSRLGYWGRVPVVLAPRGEFGAGALRRKQKKKSLYMSVFRLFHLHSGVIWHATAKQEVEDIRAKWGAGARVVLCPETTLMPPQASLPGPVDVHVRAVFVGRIVEHKGLAIALRAMAAVKGQLIFDIFGLPEDLDYLRAVRRLAEDVSPSVVVRMRGPLRPDEVRATLHCYDVLLLPTAGENFGHVIAEALSVSCAVVTTPDTPWTVYLDSGGGRIVPNRSVDDWASTIESLAGMSSAQRHELRIAAGRAYERWRSGFINVRHLFERVMDEVETPIQ